MQSKAKKRKLPGTSLLDYDISADLDSDVRGKLGRFFLRTEQLILDGGFIPRIVGQLELNEANEYNSKVFSPLIPPFNRIDFPSGAETIAVVSYNDLGEPVAASATRRYDMRGTNLKEESDSGRLYFGPRAEEVSKTVAIELTAPSAVDVTGIVSYIGAVWMRPDLRGAGVMRLLPKLIRYFTYSQARFDYEVAFSIWKDAESKFADAYSMECVERGFTHHVNGELRFSGAVAWLSEAYMLRTLHHDVVVCESSASLGEVGRRQKELVAASRDRH